MAKEPGERGGLTPVATAPGRDEMTLSNGYHVEADAHGGDNLLRIRAPDGKVCLSIQLTPDGPRLEVDAVSMIVSTRRDLRIDCEGLAINTRADLDINAGGALRQRAAGDIQIHAAGTIESLAEDAQTIRAGLGDVAIEANDDVRLDGERIRLNSPRPVTRHRVVDKG